MHTVEHIFKYIKVYFTPCNGSEGEFAHMWPHLQAHLVKAGDDGLRALSTSVTVQVPAVVAAPAARGAYSV